MNGLFGHNWPVKSVQRLYAGRGDADQQLLVADFHEQQTLLRTQTPARDDIDDVATRATREAHAGIQPTERNHDADHDQHTDAKVQDLRGFDGGVVHGQPAA